MHFKLKFSNLRFTCNSKNNNNKMRSSNNKSLLQNCRMQINLSCRPAQTIYACCQHCLSFSLGHNCPCTLPPLHPWYECIVLPCAVWHLLQLHFLSSMFHYSFSTVSQLQLRQTETGRERGCGVCGRGEGSCAVAHVICH